ncbi:helix-turn-helix transcriptional regulator [Chryseobacterium potabilaquae]|uniref:HTH cro/C1-type domain-containing protein n=1 Tax=Chryseobacterium potabilaquae TaxID=2675057 RepID=A0A6N4X7T6_9FLAO|nr:helix-turn-helix transcriptional regulator [Chryseobacterium potabilaquae]CAA7196788.1 hypothetical protein CHRY9293_02863 [Chryseobacterium potabilaquae]
MSLNDRISKVIEYSRLTSSEFADEIDVQRSSISHITSGRNKPSLEFIIKIKSRFPEILWDWLVTGDGEMLKSDLEIIDDSIEPFEEEEKPKATPLPDLFAMMKNNNDFEIEEPHYEPIKQNPRESSIPSPSKEEEKICDSQPLENFPRENKTQKTDNQESKIKRIVIFYENGKFESFEP